MRNMKHTHTHKYPQIHIIYTNWLKQSDLASKSKLGHAYVVVFKHVEIHKHIIYVNTISLSLITNPRLYYSTKLINLSF